MFANEGSYSGNGECCVKETAGIPWIFRLPAFPSQTHKV